MKTVIFDLDGTIVDSHKDITASINHVRREIYGLEPVDSAFIIEKMNVEGLNLAYEFYGVERYETEAKELFERHYSRECLKNARTFPGIPQLLESLKSRHCDLYIATNAPSHTSELILKNNNIEHYFTDIIGADRVKYAKPHPEIIETIRKRAKYEETWMVGDSPKDLTAAKRARIHAIFVEWGYTNRLPEEFRAVHKASRPSHIEDFVCRSYNGIQQKTE